MQVLEAVDVQKTYGEKTALSGVNFSMNKGEIHSLLGPNGAGKTTFIKIMATLLSKNAGTVNIMGYDLDTNEQEIRQILGYVGQDTERSAYARLTPVENLRFFGALRGLKKDEIDERLYKFSDYIDFDEHLDKQFMHLSGGQKQVVVIMRSLLHDPPIIFLDEPTKGLDPLISKKIRTFLKHYAKDEGKSLLLTSHIMTEVEVLSDRVSLIHGGKIQISETPLKLKQDVGVNDFVELDVSVIPIDIQNQLSQLDSVVTTLKREDGWMAYGVDDLFDGTQSILQILKQEGIKSGFRQSSVSLEDAFIHHVGRLDEGFDH